MKARLCRRCEQVSIPKRYTPGSFWLELALWIFFCVPGLIYSIWRLTARKYVCPVCGSDELIPVFQKG